MQQMLLLIIHYFQVYMIPEQTCQHLLQSYHLFCVFVHFGPVLKMIRLKLKQLICFFLDCLRVRLKTIVGEETLEL